MYPQHWLLQFGGTVGEVSEEWSCGIRMALFGEPEIPPGEGVNEESFLDAQAIPALETWIENTLSLVHSSTALRFIKFNEIGPDGHYADPAISHERAVNFIGGNTGPYVQPLQVCLVLSWRTDAAVRGPGSMGRIYSPRPEVVVDANGDISGPERVGAANTAATMLNTLDTSLGGIGAQVLRPSIVSPSGAGHANQIDTVVVDSQLDIQRRRAFSQSREITSAPVLY